MERRDRHGEFPFESPRDQRPNQRHTVRVKGHTRQKPNFGAALPRPAMPIEYEPPPPPSVGDVPIRRGHPFPSVEEWAERAVTPFSNFVGGEEKSLRHRAENYCGQHVGPPGRDGDVTGLDRVDAHEQLEPRKPITTKLIKPTSSRSGLQRAQ